MRRRRSLIILLSGLACVVAATSAKARTLAEIVAAGRLRIAVKDNLPPLGFRDPQGQLVGFEIDLARELSVRLLGSAEAVEWIPLPHAERLLAVTSGRVDLAIAQIGITPDRARLVSFSPPYYTDGTGIVVAKASGIGRWVELSGRSLAVLEGSAAIPYLRTFLTNVTLRLVPSYQAGADLLLAGSVAGWAADVSVLAGWLRNNPNHQLLSSTLSAVGLGIALPKDSDLTPVVTREVEALRQSGWLAQAAKGWGLP